MTQKAVCIHNLGSGSKGNASVITHAGRHLLIDCGFTRRQITLRMQSQNLDPAAICGILISHEHGDHIKGAQLCSQTFGAPILATRGTLHGGGLRTTAASVLTCGQSVDHQGFHITPLAIAHDTREPCAFVVETGGTRMLFATDIGDPASLDLDRLTDLHVVYIEANHDHDMLRDGPYPAFLKKRIAGDGGHINNDQAGALIRSIHERSPNLRAVMLAHLSDENNDPATALATTRECAGEMPGVRWMVAAQDQAQALE